MFFYRDFVLVEFILIIVMKVHFKIVRYERIHWIFKNITA